MKSKNRIKTAFFVTVLLILIGYVFFLEGSLPVNKNNKATKIFVVNQGESITSIIKKLYQADLIRSRLTFHAIVIQRGIEKSIQAGDFRLSPSMSAYKIAEALKEKSSDSNSNFYVTFGTRDKTGESTGKKYGFGSQEVLNQMK